jgi:hypothetical protein
VTFLVDLGDVSDDCCNHHLELMAKAITEPGQHEETIWAAHENPFLTEHVEDVTRRLQRLLEVLQDAFARILIGESIFDLKKADPPWLRWDETEFERVKHYLEGRHSTDYTLDDWLLVVDFLIQRYLPAGVINTEAEYLTVRAALLGKIQANQMRIAASGVKPEEIVDLVPTTFAAVPLRALSPVEMATLKVSKARAAENITGVSEQARHAMKGMIIEHVQAQVLGQKEGQATALRQRLFDAFGVLNRDFRRLAVTEAGECCNQGFVAAQDPDAKVKRKEAYRGACKFCRSIDGRVFTVVSPAAPAKDGQTEVWVGKTNVGRSASPRMRAGGTLVDRADADMWWPAAGVQHPHCRGSWLPDSEKPPEVSQEFEDWLQALVRKKPVVTTKI